MPLGRYLINSPTIAIFHEDGRHATHMVPAGAVITVDDDAVSDGDKLIEVMLGDRMVLMFIHDLRSRAELVE